ncbi:FAD-dependent oxidoreductase [Salinibacillus xinjiangensis]|uniref:FAD-binding protein n=1 Tax=Salinibacillus xinjiangensis TaxID=1229268 RepID=A0A6G1X3V2_9BACI|nr:FAD-dependent oxidoreductase [Salinibacillus xinjiangensis]MRG85599.1 FAD-binding protein [Salinibacillus xinjiangensis]
MYDIAIIGGGPAGASAAIFASKAGKKTLLVDHGKSITKKAWIKNHYGVKDIEGPDLVEVGLQQAKALGAEFKTDEINKIEEHKDHFLVQMGKHEYEAKHILLATGLSVDLAEQMGLKIVDGKEPRIARNIKVDEHGKTGKKNVWAAGTVAGESVHTIITAGHGAKVAVNIISEINGERYVDHDILQSKD